MLRKQVFAIVTIALITGGCTRMPVKLPSDFDFSGTPLQLMERLDNLDGYYTEKQFTQMEGYKIPSLVELHNMGRIKLEKLPWLTVAFGVPAYTNVHLGTMGDMHSAEIYYPSYSNRLLVHELLHAKGFPDRGITRKMGDYSPEQKAIMNSEGVSLWSETSYYKNENPEYHNEENGYHD